MFFICCNWSRKSSRSKPLPFLIFFASFSALSRSRVLLGLFDQAEHVAHAEDARGHAVGMERIERFALFAHAEELDRLAGDRPHRERGTTTRVAVDLGQDHAGQRQGVIEGLGGVGGILAGHGIDHEQGFRRLDRRVHLLDLVHHVGIDVQAACGIDDHHVDELQPRLADRRLGDGHRLLADVGREEGYADLARQGFQLLDSGGSVDVGGNHHHRLLLAFLAKRASLPAVVVLPAPCRPAIRITAGGATLSARSSLAAPISSSSSARTIFTNACPGVRLFETSVPTARSLTLLTKS